MSDEDSWSAYPSLQKEKDLAKAVAAGVWDPLPCVVTEKIDGSNFAVVVSAARGIVSVHSRTRRLAPEDKFHGLQTCIREWERDLVAFVVASGAETIVFYGEIFGKWFPNANGTFERAGAINTRVAYSPAVEMVLFDAMDARTRSFLPVTAWQSHPLFIRVLYRGSFAECAAWAESNRNMRTTYSRDGHEQLLQQAEGVVVRSVANIVVRHERFMFKVRSDAFQEHASVTVAVAPKPVRDNPFLAYVTPQWFANFLSKHANHDDFMKRFREFLDAAMLELAADADAPRIAGPDNRKMVGAALKVAFDAWRAA